MLHFTGLILSQKQHFACLALSHLNTSSFEFHSVTVTSPTNCHIIIIYHPPGLISFLRLYYFLITNVLLIIILPSDGTSPPLLVDFSLPSVKL